MSSLIDRFSTQRIYNNNWNSYPLPRVRQECITRKVTAVTFKDSPGYVKISLKENNRSHFIDLTSYASARGLKDCDIKFSFNCTLDDFIKNNYTYEDIGIEGDFGSEEEFSKYIQLFRVMTSYIGTRNAYECRRNINV